MYHSSARRRGLRVSLAALTCIAILLSHRQARAVGPLAVWTAANAAIDAVKKLYSGTQWISCLQGNAGNCPESDAHKEATRVITELSGLVEKIDTDHAVAGVQNLLDESQRLYGDPTRLSHDDENALIATASDLFDYFVQKLNNTSPTNEAEVEAAYALSPAFNILAALVDNIGRTALARGQVAMSYDWINERRNRTLRTNHALVGAQSVWYQCGGDGPGGYQTMANTVGSVDNSFPTKKFWKLFADYGFSRNDCSNDCNVFRATTPGALICQHSCWPFCFEVCGVDSNDWVFGNEFPKILAKMAKDPVVRTVRASMESLVDLGTLNGSGVLWQLPSGEIDLSVMSGPDYRAFPLAGADPSVWKPIGTGDFNGDGSGDILWLDSRDGLLSIWGLNDHQVTSMTPATHNVPSVGSGLTPYIGDLDGDGVSDIVWTGGISVGTPGGTVSIYMTQTWMMDPGNATTPRSAESTSSQSDRLVGLGAFERFAPDPDPTHHVRVQKLYRTPATGEMWVDGYGSHITLGYVGDDWAVKAIGAFNGESTDILWYHAASGSVAMWSIRGYQLAANVTVGTVDPSYGWTPQGFGDVDNDGTSDIIWRHTSGVVNIWKMAHWGVARDWFAEPTSVSPGDTLVGVVNIGPPAPANAAPAALPDYYCGVANGHIRSAGFSDAETWSWNTFDGGYGTLLGDVNDDGKADMVTLGGSEVGLLLSAGSWFGDYQRAWPGAFYGNHGTLLGDIDGDGKADLVALGDGYIGVLRARDNSIQAFGNYETWWHDTFDGGLGTMLGDIDGDGKADLVGIGYGYVGVIRSTGGGFGNYETGLWDWFWGNYGTLLGDVDGDGKADLVALIDGSVAVRRATGATAGNPLFGDYETWYYGTFYGTRASFLRDVDGDGKADLVSLGDDNVTVIRSNGFGFGSPEIWWGSGFSGTHGAFIGDIDGNGKADLVEAGDGYINALRSQ